jgi:hypothetical protein
MMMSVGVEVELHPSWLRALDGDKCPASPTNRFIPGERAHFGAWVSPAAVLEAMQKRTSSDATGYRTPGVQPVACRYTD